MDLRPFSYDEMCQLELLQADTLAAAQTVSATGNANANVNSGMSTTVLPIMVVPGTLVTTTSGGGGNGGDPNMVGVGTDGNCEHFYQLQPAHIFAAATSSPAAGSEVGGVSLAATPTTLLQAQTIFLPTEHMHTQQHPQQQQHQQQQQQQQQQYTQQIPQAVAVTPGGTVNFFGTLSGASKLRPPSASSSSLTRQALESTATLPRGFQPATFITSGINAGANAGDESDFDGSECGASVSSSTTCIPHFRFGGCGVVLQPTTSMQHQHHHQHAQPHQPTHESTAQPQHHHQQVIGCGSLSHMMGSFAAVAGGAMHTSGRFAGNLLGGGVNATLLTGTLGGAARNRRSQSCRAGSTTSIDGSAGVGHASHGKRVSFKGDNLPPDEMQMDEHDLRADTFNNCSYMHFDNFMDYQTTGFGGLPDVTEHSNIRRTLSRQNSISNSDTGGGGVHIGAGGGLGEIASIQKAKSVYSEKSPTNSAALDDAGGGVSAGGIGGVGGLGVGGVVDGLTVGCGGTLSKRHLKSKSKSPQSVDIGGSSTGTRERDGRYKSGRRSTYALALTVVVVLCLFAIAVTLAYQHFLMTPSRNSQSQRLRIVQRILHEVPLVDGHNNFAWNVRKYAHNSLEVVHLSHHDSDHKSIWSRPAWAQTDIERLKQGLVGVQIWSAYVPCEAQGLDAVQLALEQIDIIRRLTDMYPQETVLVTSSKDIATARRRGQMASLIGIEGGHSIGSSLGVLRSFYSLGARYLSLTHKCDVSWAGSAATSLENGLSQFGKAIIREMNRLGMMVDLSYSSDVTARDVLQVTRAPVIFSHSAARTLCNSTRNIPDDILRLVAENGGLIMISFDSEDVACGRQAHLTDVINHIKYIRSIAGIQHIGLGAGYDSIELPPVGLEDVSKYPDLLAYLLEDHNWSEEDIGMLAGKNFLRIMETVENVRDYWKRAAIQPVEQSEPQPKTQCTYMIS